MKQTKPLPANWVDRIFARLQGFYGSQFRNQYCTGVVDGVDVGLENAKQVWSEELGCFSEWPEALAYGLENLPERAPNLVQFRNLCRNAPAKPEPKQIVHQPTPEQIAINRQRVQDLLKSFRAGNGNGNKTAEVQS